MIFGDIYVHKFTRVTLPGFLTLPTAYVTGNPVECVIHPKLWNQSSLMDPLGIGLVDSLGQSIDDEYEEENYGYPISQVSPTFLLAINVINITMLWYSSVGQFWSSLFFTSLSTVQYNIGYSWC